MGLLFRVTIILLSFADLNFLPGCQPLENVFTDASRVVNRVPRSSSIEMQLFPRRLINLDIVEGHIEISAILVFKWNTSEFSYGDGIEKEVIDIEGSGAWLPEIILQNGIFGPSQVIQPTEDRSYTMAKENYTSWIKWQYNTGIQLKARCSFDLKTFPHDTQTCYFSLSAPSLAKYNTNITVSGEKGMLSWRLYYVEDPEWDLIDTSEQRQVRVLPFVDKEVVHIDFGLTFRRSKSYYYERFVIPAILVAFILPFIFLLHPENRDRVVIYAIFFGILLYLMTTLSGQIGEKFGGNCRLVTFYRVTMVIDVACMVISIIIIQMYSRGGKRGRVPSFCRQVIIGCGNAVCLLDRFIVRLYQPPPVTEKKDKEKAGSSSSSNEVVKVLREQDAKNQASVAAQDMRDEWRQFTLTLDRIFFFIFFFIFIVYTVALLG